MGAGAHGHEQRPAARILVIEDALDVAATIRLTLESENYAVEIAPNGATGLQRARDDGPDIVLLDIGLPDTDGMEVCRQLRTFSDAYVIMLTARDTELDRVVGLSVGADDYVTKPFSPLELLARVRAMLRRPRTTHAGTPADADPVYRLGELVLDSGAREVTLGDRIVELSRLEYEVLAMLMANPRQSLSRERLLAAVWGPNWYGDDHVIDVHVSNLRRKLGDDPRRPRYVRTVRGHGFRLGDG